MSQQQAANAITETSVELFPFRRVLVLLTETDADTCVLRYLSMLEDARGTGPLPRVQETSILPLPSDARAGYSRRPQSGKVQAAGLMTEPRTSISVSFHTLGKDNLRDLVDLLARPDLDLVLVGRPSHRMNARRTLPIIRRLALNTACPIWIVPETATNPRFQTIVVPMDFGESCGEAAEMASSLAAAWRIPECLALHAYFSESRFPSQQGVEALNEGKWHAFSECTSRLSRNAPWFKLHFEEGRRVSKVIERFAERVRADLIVMGADQRSRWAAAALGSTLLETIEGSRIPVLVVKTGRKISFFREVLEAVLHPKDVLQTS